MIIEKTVVKRQVILALTFFAAAPMSAWSQKIAVAPIVGNIGVFGGVSTIGSATMPGAMAPNALPYSLQFAPSVSAAPESAAPASAATKAALPFEPNKNGADWSAPTMVEALVGSRYDSRFARPTLGPGAAAPRFAPSRTMSDDLIGSRYHEPEPLEEAMEHARTMVEDLLGGTRRTLAPQPVPHAPTMVEDLVGSRYDERLAPPTLGPGSAAPRVTPSQTMSDDLVGSRYHEAKPLEETTENPRTMAEDLLGGTRRAAD